MTQGHPPNNPRASAETVSVDAWRTKFGEGSAEADLHIDVVFSQGRVGGGGSSPVRFRLSLKRAEIRVRRDSLGTIRIPPHSVTRTPIVEATKTTQSETTKSLEGKGALAAAPQKIGVSVHLKGHSAMNITERIDETAHVYKMTISHRKNDDGYSFIIIPNNQDRLVGQPWSSESPRLRLRDSKADRKRGEPPEPTIELRCKREDLIIEDIQFTEQSGVHWFSLSREKQLAVEQYIKEQLVLIGFECGDISDPFCDLLLADVIPDIS